MNQAKIEIYTKDFCPYCVRAKNLLDNKGLKYIEYNVGNDPEKRSALVELSHGRKTVPQIFINGRHIGGSDDLYAFEKSGELDKILKKVG